MRRLLLFLVLASAAPSQPTPGSISGVVVNAPGSSVKDAFVWIQLPDGRQISARSDAEGRYTLKDVPPGQYQLAAQLDRSAGASRRVEKLIRIEAGMELRGIALVFPSDVSISGKVVDEKGEPVPRIAVYLVAKEYYAGAIGYYTRGRTLANEKGEYETAGGLLQPGRTYLLLAKEFPQPLPADAPPDAKERKPVIKPAYYPGAEFVESAEAVILRPGERREGLNIRIKRSPSYCADGVIDSGGKPAAVEFEFAEQWPSDNGPSQASMGPTYKSDDEGHFRICGLHRGDYRLSIARGPAAGSSTLVTITDEDRHDLKIHGEAPMPLSGEVVWDGETPQKPLGPLTINAAALAARLNASVSFARPGPFRFPGLPRADYRIRIGGFPDGVYVKEMTYGGLDVLHEPMRFGSAAPGAGLRVVLARDGGFIQAKVGDTDGNPVSQAWVYVMPDGVPSSAALSAALVSGRTDQTGAFASGALRPGKYYVLASETEAFPTPESMDALWRARTRATEVELAPKGTAAVKLEPVTIE